MRTLVVIGTGLIGGSFALAAKRAQLVETVIGFDVNKSALVEAKKLGVIDQIKAVTKRPDLVCVAVPTRAIAKCVIDAQRKYGSNVPIFDTGSVKVPVIEAFESIPTHFVPCHPVAGSDRQGPGAADADLFQDRAVIMTPLENTDASAAAGIEDAWARIGARVIRQAPGAHDDDMALVSHLPHLIGFALVELLVNSDQHVSDRIGDGFRDMTRIAGSDPTIWRHILSDNAGRVRKKLDELVDVLETLQKAAQDDSDDLQRILTRISRYRRRLDG
ncbi:MAG: prephenate dehydrogenase/arogenate dehydrogenase family protein [Pseudomonadales bacterium]